MLTPFLKNKTSCNITSCIALMLSLFTNTAAAEIKRIDKHNIIEYMYTQSQKKPLVIHFTSSDPQCGHCRKNNQRMLDVQADLHKDFDFVAVEFNPWRSLKQEAVLRENYKSYDINLRGLPDTYVFYQSTLITNIHGNNTTLKKGIEQSRELIKVYDNPASVTGKAVPTIKHSELEAYLKENSRQFTLIHFTSDGDNCDACQRNNAYFQRAYHRFAEHYNFIEVRFNPWEEVNQEKALRKQFKIRGLPHLAISQNLQLINTQSGVIPSLEKGLADHIRQQRKQQNKK